jgi:hypothetical protein
MKTAIKIEKLQITEVPVNYQKEEGCIAFQMVKFTYVFYGKEMTDFLDTKILKNGKQIVCGGNGFINHGFEIN